MDTNNMKVHIQISDRNSSETTIKTVEGNSYSELYKLINNELDEISYQKYNLQLECDKPLTKKQNKIFNNLKDTF